MIKRKHLHPLGALALLLIFMQPALSALPDERLSDPARERRAENLGEQLRCLVCQNQSIEQSDAPLAHDLRVFLRQRIEAGDTDTEVEDRLVARYGDYVRLNPPLKPRTALLWLGPSLLLCAGAAAARSFYRSSKDRIEPALTELEKQRLRDLAEDDAAR